MSSKLGKIIEPISGKLFGGKDSPAAPAPVAPAPVTPVAATPDASESALLTREAKRRKAGSASGVTVLGGAPRRSDTVASRELLG